MISFHGYWEYKMKTRLLIIIGIIVVIAVSLSSFAIYESSTVVFISCDPRYEQIDGKCVKKDDGIGEEPAKTPPPEPPFEKEEPFTKIEIMFGEQLNDKLVPVTFTEVTTNAETLDEIMVWNFQLIGHSGDDRRVVWDILPKDKRIWYEITDDNGQDIRMTENIAIPLDLHNYEMNCGFFQTVEGESAHPTLLQIKKNTSTIYAQNSRMEIYPDSNGEYSFEFASIFENYVSFPEDAVEIMSRETRKCKLTHNVENDLTGKYIDGYYTKMTFRFN